MACFSSTLRIAIAFVGTLLIAPSISHAEPLVVSAEAQAAFPVTTPQSDWFGPGGALALAVHYPVTPVMLVGARLRAGLLSDGEPPQLPGVADPGWGSFELASLAVRLRPFARADDARLGTGLFIEAAGGGGFTGKLVRPSVEAGLGYGIALGPICLAPTLRYLHVFQPAKPPSDDDARLVLAGLELTFNDVRPPPPVAAPKAEVKAQLPDRDHDGIPDVNDRCPDAAEDRDGFQDEDGCPDPDNDLDGIPDGSDRCPLAAEVINGVDDLDGCPDEGEIVFKNDRIVLEERVLFDFEYARVRSRAHKVLDAIVRLRSQHPEWGAIQIEGHCDVRGDDELNQKLSERRARNVMRKLIEWGIPAEVMSYAGYGRTRPIDHGTSEEAHQRNRRVEFVVLTRVPVKLGASAQQTPESPLQVKPLAAEPESEDDEPAQDVGEPAPAEAAPAVRSPLSPLAPSQGENRP